MATYYIDPSQLVNGLGSFISPFNSYSFLPVLNPGDKVLQKISTIFYGHITVSQSGTETNPIIFGVYDLNGNEISKKIGAASISGIGLSSDNFSTQAQNWITIQCFEFINVTSGRFGVTLGSSATAEGCKASYCRVSNQSLAAAGFNVRTNPGIYPNVVEYSEANYNTYGILFQGGGGGGALEFIGNTCSYNAEAGIRIAISTSGAIVGTIRGNICQFNGVAQGITGKGIGIDNVSDSYGLLVEDNNCSDNYSIGIRLATFGGLINQSKAFKNICDRNGEFGIQVSRGAGFYIYKNKCRWNGADRGNRYGRGIELYSSNGSFPVGPGIVQLNNCSYNYNYGGTLNNGTEGCGIGLDDNHKDILVIGNVCIKNEGNGIQFNSNGATGSSIVVGNLLKDNFCVPVSRFTSNWPTHSFAQIGLFTSESNAKIYNNTFILTNPIGCLYGVSESPSSLSSGINISNNIFIGHVVGLKIRDIITRFSNSFWQNSKNVENNIDNTTLTDGAGAILIDPKLNFISYTLKNFSPLISAGTFFNVFQENSNILFWNPPSVGAYEYIRPKTITSTRTIRS